jgi:hypothetical protein
MRLRQSMFPLSLVVSAIVLSSHVGVVLGSDSLTELQPALIEEQPPSVNDVILQPETEELVFVPPPDDKEPPPIWTLCGNVSDYLLIPYRLFLPV